MKVALINEYKDKFKKRLIQSYELDEAYKYECLQNYKNNWDLSALKLEEVFDESFSSTMSGRLWGGSKDSAKEMMLRFMAHDREFMRSAFRDLYTDYKDVTLRISRFKLHCDEMMEQLQKKDKKLNHHYQDNKVISVYLTFHDPKEYNIFDFLDFKRMMMRLEAKDAPAEFEVERYFKVSRGLYKILSKDQELVDLHKAKLKGEQYYQDESLLLVHDYISICSKI